MIWFARYGFPFHPWRSTKESGPEDDPAIATATDGVELGNLELLFVGFFPCCLAVFMHKICTHRNLILCVYIYIYIYLNKQVR